MPCPEFVKLSMHYCSAEFRVWRYSYPDAEPRLVSPIGFELQNRLKVAQDELVEFRNGLQIHLGECAECKADGATTPPKCSKTTLR
jgi:hypothetical protein